MDAETGPLRDTRRQILAAAEQVIAELGLKHATTRAIAERAGCAEGSIYRYFTGKHALFMEVVKSRSPEFHQLCGSIHERAGTGDVAETLQEVAVAALAFYREVVPMACGALADPEMMAQQRRHFRETGGGPMWSIRAVTSYLVEEQRLGRVSPTASPDHAARLLLGMCFADAYLRVTVGEEARLGADQDVARATVRQLMAGLGSGDMPDLVGPTVEATTA